MKAAFSTLAAVLLLSRAAAGTPATSPGLPYGKLGKPVGDFADLDSKIATRSPEKTLALFRYKVAHPPKGTEDQPITMDEVIEGEEYARELFYTVVQRAPQFIQPGDWKLIRAQEKDLMETICETSDNPASYNLSAKDCAALAAHK